MRLRPGEQFPISWQVSDPNDTTTYYVQAKVKNGRTGALLATVNLTDNGSGYFSRLYQVPQDTSGLGFYIEITVTVYTDSGYTNKSPNFNIEHRSYQIKEEVVSFGGSGGADVDYERIRKMIAEIVGKAVQGLPKPYDGKAVVNDIYERFDTLQFALVQEMEASALRNKVEVKPTDLTEVKSAIENAKEELSQAITDAATDTQSVINENLEGVGGKLDTLGVDKILRIVADVYEILNNIRNRRDGQKVEELKASLKSVMAQLDPDSEMPREDKDLPRVAALLSQDDDE